MEPPLVNALYQLQKFPGKGGWTYASIPEVLQNKNTPFGWVKVNGSIDDYPLLHYKLMPMGNGTLFLPVKAEIRKKIKKQEGDWVMVTLYADTDSLVTSEEILLCFKDEPEAYAAFCKLSETKKAEKLNWIKNGKEEVEISNRIATTIQQLIEN